MWRIPGNSGGESETIIGEWFAARGRREDVVVATKVGSLPSRPGLSAANIAAAVEDSLRRLQTDHIDLYWAHKDDPETPQEETLVAFDALVRAGKVRAIGASNFGADRLESALAISARDSLAAYVALQPHYNLMERTEFETTLAPVLAEHGLSCVPYYGLAKGFLTGKYRPGSAAVDSPRAEGARAYLDERGRRVLAALGRGRRGPRRAGGGGRAGVVGRATHGRGADRERPHHRAAHRAAPRAATGAVRAGGRDAVGCGAAARLTSTTPTSVSASPTIVASSSGCPSTGTASTAVTGGTR